MNFQIGDYFKVTSNGNAGRIVGLRTHCKVGGNPVRKAYQIVWAHHPKKSVCQYAIDIVDLIWEPTTEAYFESRPIVTPEPPKKKDHVITVPAGFIIDAKVIADASVTRYKRAGETMSITFKADYKKGTIEAECDHQMQPYIGFSQSFNFCTKCDHKTEIPK